MTDFLDNLRSQIAALRVEIEELETAQRVYLRMNPTRTTNRRKFPRIEKRHTPKIVEKTEQNGDFSSLNALDAAKRILHAAGKPLHYKEVFVAAVSRGYRSGRGNGEGKPNTFEVTMRRKRDIFKAEGNGKFSLKEK